MADAKHLDFADMVENAPCGHVLLTPGGRVEYVNRTFLGWSGYAADQMLGKRLSDFLAMAGRIYYETHIAPLLRMQASFEEFAIDAIKADAQPLQMIANASERRDEDGKPSHLKFGIDPGDILRKFRMDLRLASAWRSHQLASAIERLNRKYERYKKPDE